MNKRQTNIEKDYAWTLCSKGKRVKVSLEDLDLLVSRSSHVNKSGYVCQSRQGKEVYIHKLIQKRIGFTGECDHKNRDKRDCRRDNLRKTDRFANLSNQGISKSNTSGFLGVFLRKSGQIISKIGHGKTVDYLGTFKSTWEAALVYDKAAIEKQGPQASTNESLGLFEKYSNVSLW